jgi:hypothetical protein
MRNIESKDKIKAKINEQKEGYIYVKTDKPYYHPGD